MISFDQLGLNTALLDAIKARGFETPTPIQAEMIPFLLTEERDVTGLAQTGTGKTAAFGLPILQNLDLQSRSTQALILTPTRELGLQVSREIAEYGKNLRGLRTTTVYGGAPFGPQIRDLRAGPHIITATPGRLKDLLDKGIADLSALRFLVLDEADQMLDMGFKDELDAILATANPSRRTLLFSATMPPEVARIAATYMKNPHEIVSGRRNQSVGTVIHYFYRVHAHDKYEALRRLIDVKSGMYAIIFCRTRETVKDVAARLSRDGYTADALHGELAQNQRDSVMDRFREGNPSLLVATDVAARGLDVDNLTHVIHYDLPDEVSAYTHRSGRTGRAGKSGASLALVHMREGHRVAQIERIIGRKMEEAKIPRGHDICEARLMDLLLRVKDVEVNEEAVGPYLQAVRDSLAEFDREELLQRFISVEFNRFLEQYAGSVDLNPTVSKAPPKRRESGPMVSLRLNVGRRQSILPPQIIGMINKATDSGNIRIGRINIDADSCEVQVDSAMAQRVEQALNGYSFQGKTIRVERVADRRPATGKQRGPWRSSGKDRPPARRPKKGRKDKASRNG
ncbi:MAG: DEAD/DEAH box helicase [Spirochaetaceae bacterium]|nr:MAG: DEAD/DEAH box helicase [Spirochaetaceae bacterium]